jgi:hypothetical protein
MSMSTPTLIVCTLSNIRVASNTHCFVAADVRYLPRNPEVNMSGDPHAALGNEVASIALTSILMPACAIFGVSLRLKNWKSRRQSGVA